MVQFPYARFAENMFVVNVLFSHVADIQWYVSKTFHNKHGWFYTHTYAYIYIYIYPQRVIIDIWYMSSVCKTLFVDLQLISVSAQHCQSPERITWDELGVFGLGTSSCPPPLPPWPLSAAIYAESANFPPGGLSPTRLLLFLGGGRATTKTPDERSIHLTMAFNIV